jgi:dipeptidase
MCDTFTIPPELSQTGRRILAKNSDREPNEAQDILVVPRQNPAGGVVRLRSLLVPHVEETHAVILSKPFHMWGAEMGVNEHGLAIGNEAVFTRIGHARKEDGMTGMEMLRLALESCRTAAQALDRISALVEAYGQDACGGYRDRGFYYDNSFLITDPTQAFILETAGRHWVFRAAKGFQSISNRLTIESEWDGISGHAIDFAHRRGWVPRGRPFSFSKAYTSPLMSRLSMASQRRTACMNLAALRSGREGLGLQDAFTILRSHATEEFAPHKGRMDSLCLHATGLLTPSQTTASMVAELDPSSFSTVWLTGSSAPCLSLFKPFFTDACQPSVPISKPSTPVPNDSHWWRWEEWHRMAIRRYPAARKLWREHAEPIEREWTDLASLAGSWDRARRLLFTRDALERSDSLIASMKERLRNADRLSVGWLYGLHWDRRDRQAGFGAL